ncbi:TonB-dependent receptor [Opitutus sp. ER46]|uniref:TonB-dependent receptor plug domain-containing protein n=1 Tax=Opitutus sp. ER46 TaxID=2161864 RepID=UPI000D2F887B|nr:TonB-dependent receptor [Opitutus sp. ER46]PTX91468.1 hypothetical protein DB354_16395 [Opitutus sp. ER46]
MQNVTSRRLRAALFATIPLLVAPVTRAASEPTVPAPDRPPTAPAVVPVPKEPDEISATAPTKLAPVEVTGSRIRTLGAEVTSLPVFSLNQIELERRGVERLADIRWAIPQLGAAVGFNDNLMNGGTSRAQQVGTSFNLRGIGGNSTLVLIDGRRIPHTGQEAPGGAGGREDFSVDGIPISAIERIDVLPEGAGAVYGSEAIAGVVNIVLKKNYTGAELRVVYDNTFDSDVGQTTVSLVAGFRAKKLSTFLTLSYENQNGLAAKDRWFSATYDTRIWGSTSTSFLYNGAAGTGTLGSSSYPFYPGQANLPGLTTNKVSIPTGSNGTTAANAAYTTTGATIYDAAQYAMSIDPATRKSVIWKNDYDLLPWARVYGEARWSRFENSYIGSPVSLTTALPAGYPGNPFSSTAYLSKVFWDLPRPQTESAQENMAVTLGVKGDFLSTWRYDVNASWARNVVSDDAIAAGFNYSLLNAAMNSANKPILAYDSLNGRDPNAAGVLAALMPVADHKDTTDTYQYSATADGTVWDGWAGALRAAVGVEAGEEKVKFWREPSPVTPTYVLTKPFSRRLEAAFAEVTVPLLSKDQHIPLVHRLEVGGAVRATDYSDAGSVTTPTYRALFQPVKWLTVRGSRSEGFKPVRLYDLQAPVSKFTSTLTSTSRVFDPLRGNEAVLGTYDYLSGGNPTLKPEDSVSRNAGIVIDIPGRWFKGFSVSADYYDLEYSDRSGSTSLQNLLNYFPERISRATPTADDIAHGYAGRITGWDASNLNLAKVWTKGWDYQVRYHRMFGANEISIIAALSDPNVIYTKATPAATPSSTYGHQPKRARYSAFWANGPWSAGVSVAQQGKYFINGLSSTAYPSIITWDPQVSYNFGGNPRFHKEAQEWWVRGLSGMKVSLTIVNVFNREPSMADAANGRIVVDPRLRRYIVSAAKKF